MLWCSYSCFVKVRLPLKYSEVVRALLYVFFIWSVKPTMSWQCAAATVHPFPHSSEGRKPVQCVYVCILTRWQHFVCVCRQGSKWSHSFYIKQDFPEQSAPATELPKSSSGFPPQHKLCGRGESRLFVLERHCSGAAEGMSQHCRHSAHLPCIAQLLKCLGAFMSPSLSSGYL